MHIRKKFYFFGEEIRVNEASKRDGVVGRLRIVSDIINEPEKVPDDPYLIHARFRADNPQGAAKRTQELRRNFSECEVIEWEGYMDYRSREENKKLNKALRFAAYIYLTTLVSGSTVTGLLNQVTLQTPIQVWGDALFKAVLIAIPATIVAYKKPPEA